MFRNLFKSSLRHLRRNRANTAINILSLTIGITVSIVIYTIIRYQFSFDHYHSNADRVYRVNFLEQKEWGISYGSQTPEPLHKILRADYPQIEAVTRSIGPLGLNLYIDEQKFEQNEILFVDGAYFKMFDHEWLRGSEADFEDPKAVVLTESVAKKLFGDQDPMGKPVDFMHRDIGTVTGIIKDTRKNTNLPNQIIANRAMMQQIEEFYVRDNWGAMSIGTTWVMLPENVNPVHLSSQFQSIIEKNLGEEYAEIFTFELGPLKTLHTDDRYGNGVNYTIPGESIYILSAIALIILATSLINFVNLTTAQALKKSSEIGLRKILGSNKKELATQNFIELGLQVLIATFLSIWLAEVLLHQVNMMITQVSIDLKVEWYSVIFAMFLGLFIVFVAGFYPTAMLIAFNPLQVLRGKFNQTKGAKATVRNTLLVIQFVFAQVLMIVLLVFNAQFKYIETKDLGYTTDNIVAFRDFMKSRYTVDETQLNTVKTLLKESPYIEEVTYGTGGPNAMFAWSTQVYTPEMGEKAAVVADYKHVDIDYQSMFELELVAGNWFTQSNYYDTTQKVLVTELLLEKIGLSDPEAAIGQRLNVNGSTGMIIGVLKDFHTGALTNEIRPSIFEGDYEGYNQGFLKFKEGYFSEAMSHFEKVSTAYNDDYTPYYISYTDELATNYELDRLIYRFVNFVAILALAIGSLGLYSLISYIVQQKTKELGIRKVIGADINSLMYLLSKKYVLFILIATVIAAPLGYMGAEFWLETFAYRTNIGYVLFFFSFLITSVIAMGSISYRTYKAATLDPVKSLRYE
ncbi:MAG TPA: ABC transporter permease [Roseivirga sp.]